MRKTKPYKNLRDKMTPEQREASETMKNLATLQMSLQELRQEHNLTQAELASSLDVVQSALSKLENQGDILVSTLSRYIAALGGKLVIAAEFPNKMVRLSQFALLKGDQFEMSGKERSGIYNPRINHRNGEDMAKKSTPSGGKTTSPQVAKKASSNLRSANSNKAEKTASGSALAQTGNKKVTSPAAASKASEVLRDAKSSKKEKSAAASAPSQTKPKKS